MNIYKGFTVIEVLAVIIIVCILASLVLANFTAQIEKARSREAENNLLVIYNAQKRYKLTQGQYYVCAPQCTLQKINENLTLAIHGVYHFNYSIAAFGPANEGYRAIAQRKSGKCANKNMTVSYINGSINKECPLW